MDSTESPKSLYALSLRQVVHRLNRLCNYVKVGRHLDDQLLFLSEKGDKTGLFFSPPPADILVCFEHHHPSSSRQVQRLSFNHQNEGDQNLEEGEEGEEDVVKRNSPFCDEFSSSSSSSSSSRSFLHGGRSSSSSSNGIGNLDANSIDNNAKLLKNRMKKSYHSLLNTFIFGGGSSSSSGNSSKKPPMSPNGSLVSSSFSSSSSSFSNSSSSENSPPSEQDRLRASYRVAADLVEDIFNEYQRRYPLTDRSLKLAIFGGSVNRFRRVEIKEAGQLTTGGLSMLAGHHQLTSLSVAHLNSAAVSINELISCLAPVTAAQHLTSLSVRHCNFSGSRPYNSGCSSKAACLVLSIGQLPRLTNLDVSFTDFNNHALEVVAEDLPHLVSLNISSTKVTLLGPIALNRGLVSRLKVLLAHNTSGSCRDEHLLEGLTSLERLDISDSRSYLDTSQNSLNKLLAAFATFPKLVELDLSGRNGVDYHEVEQLVVARQSTSSGSSSPNEVTPLRFLGLLETNLNYDDLLDLMKASAEPITLTGNGNIHHILESLRRYRDCSVFVQKSLLHLYQTRFNLDSEEMLAQRPSIIRLILDLLTTYLSSVNIVLVSTACLYIFTQMNVFAGGGGGNGSNHPPLHPHLLTKVVKVNMATMTKYATNQPVMKNILLTLCSDRILQEIPFDRMHCMQLVMDSLITFSEPTLNRLALAVCSILAAKIPTEQTTSIGQQVKYMGRLLEFVQRSNAAIDTDNRDVLFKLALSALWNFTDESPKTCQTFIENRGLQLYIEALVLYHGQNSVETKILGLINNIAEVPYLRKDLIDGNLLANLKNLIQSEHIDISYFSAGILSQLASDRSLDWSQLKDFSLPEVLDEMKQVILSWQTPNFEMVAYRSFVPFIALLTCRPHPAVQLWALWAIHHVCTKSGSQKYCQMLYDERCLSLIADILDDRIRAIGRQNAAGGSDCFSSLAQVAFMQGRLVRNATPDCYPSGGDLPFENGNGSGNGSRQNSPSRANKDLPQCSFLFSPCVTVPQEKEVLKVVEEKEEVLQLMLHRSNTNQLSLFTCDCKLAHYLRRDPFLALPALILHTFAQECPRLVAKDFQF